MREGKGSRAHLQRRLEIRARHLAATALLALVPAGAALLAPGALAKTGGAKPLPTSASCPDLSVYPSPDTKTASPTTQISFRNVASGVIEGAGVTVTGSRSGTHAGRWVADSDHRGASFYPAQPFQAGETVSVTGPLRICGAGADSYHFQVARQPGPLATAPAASATPTPALDQPTVTYASQPGVQVPILKIKKASSLGGDYIFEAPKGGTKLGGPMILNSKGQEVWFEPLPPEVSASDVTVQTYDGQPALTWWKGIIVNGHGIGSDLIMNSGYQVVATVNAGNGYQADLHEFRLSSDGTTAWITAYNTVGWNLKSEGGPGDGAVLDGIVQEIDVATGNVLFEWHSLDHVAPALSYVAYSDTSAYDYFHVNSIEPLGAGLVLISSRNTHAVYALDQATGQIEWRLGGKRSSFAMGAGANFALQHDAEMHGSSTISIFDDEDVNGNNQPARVIVDHLDYQARTATLERAYGHGSLVVPAQGNGQLLPDGDVFVGWGSGIYTSEYSRSGKLLFDATFGSSVNSYRAYLLKWKGEPATPPALALGRRSGQLVAYASWNGSTETRSWELLGGSSATSLEPLGTARASGFQTALRVTGAPAMVEVVAEGANGQALGSSAVVSTAGL